MMHLSGQIFQNGSQTELRDEKAMKESEKQTDICMHCGDEYDRYLGAIVPPLFQNTLFTRKNRNHGYVYSRINNPTLEIAEQKMAALEKGEAARCFSSGMAAITAAITSLLQSGDHVITLKSVYYPVKSFLRDYACKFQITVSFVEGDSVQEIEDSIRPNTKLIYLESPSSNIFVIQDLRAIAALAQQHGIKTVIDNTWATPIFQNPLTLGIDYVVHSATKYLGGHSDLLGGVVIGDEAHMNKLTNEERAFYGGVMDPHSAWLLIRSLRTLKIRMKQHEESALAVAEFLQAHPKVKQVFYPGLPAHPHYEIGKAQMSGYSGLLSFILDVENEKAVKVIKNLRFVEEGPSWGGFESVMNTPGIGAGEEFLSKNGTPNGLIRLSVGLEDTDSLIEDLGQSLDRL